MIKGIGIDITHISRFKKIIQKSFFETSFLTKVLNVREQEEYNSKQTEDLKAIYIASRWSFKEALVKATGNKGLIFSKIYLTKAESGKYNLILIRKALCVL
jgi:phosphopantetheine--protein transferase-like protein